MEHKAESIEREVHLLLSACNDLQEVWLGEKLVPETYLQFLCLYSRLCMHRDTHYVCMDSHFLEGCPRIPF